MTRNADVPQGKLSPQEQATVDAIVDARYDIKINTLIDNSVGVLRRHVSVYISFIF